MSGVGDFSTVAGAAVTVTILVAIIIVLLVIACGLFIIQMSNNAFNCFEKH
ncbi:hypothetical protein LC087_11205 [Bacillus carboniphilus]|uniref:Uncharacterized protein n=1 Tax=Bacillus carboniphilus TaxID=86663 RepID=A0ABY9JUY2_9BACI|nr:hypothetical protein [Bacillus carboniphilus]WLR41465.1 hypothetical protein LC087_11205 [Bacillus carboniphilus]